MQETIVITGASSGFGKGVARTLAARDCNLVLAARREDLIGELAEEIKRSIAVPTDVASIDDMRHVHDRAIAEFGHIDVWINNAGVGAIGPFTEIPLEDQIRVVETNLIGALNGSYLAMRHFRERGRGTLINIASIAGKVAVPYYGIYGATKSGVQFLSASIRQELKQTGEGDDIHVCVVNPWATATPFWEHSANYTGHALRMPFVDEAQHVVEAIVDLIANPKDEVNVSIPMKGASVGRHLAPGLTEDAAARAIHSSLMDQDSRAPRTSGSVHRPMRTGRGVHAEMRDASSLEEASG
jgi:short-subunit dehydrogenase